jgi:hypothetical protein
MALTIGDNFNYQGAKPLDARLTYATLAEMAAKADSTLYNGILAYCVATDKTYQWKSTNTSDPDTGKWREFTTGGGGQTIQLSTMPSAGADEVGHIYEYIGDTSASFINGRFYKCVTDGTTYEWAEVLMNDNETQEISKADFDALPQSEKDNGKAYFIPDASVVSNFTVMGNRFDKANIYTAEERMVGSWMGKPLYQKTFVVDGSLEFTANSWLSTSIVIDDGEAIIDAELVDRPPNSMARAQIWGVINSSTNVVSLLMSRSNNYPHGAYVTLRYTKTNDATVNIGTGNDYSTDEMIVGTWIDGKPIYQKTILNIEAKSPTSGSVTETKYDISDLSIDTLVGIKNRFHQEVSGSIAELFDFSSAPTMTNNQLRCTMVVYYALNSSVNAGNLVISNSIGFTRYVTVTLQYTKTTD